jgi:hypothetical protein
MTRYTLLPPFARVHGKLTSTGSTQAQVLTSSSTTGPAGRRHTYYALEPTQTQRDQRSRIAQIAKTWTKLTSAQASAWRALARTLARNNALGTPYTLSGINLFQIVNTYRMLNAQAITTTPPTNPTPPPPLFANITLGLTPVGGRLAVSLYAPPIPDSTLVLIRATPGQDTQSYLPPPSKARIPSTDTTLSFATITAGAGSATPPLNNVTITDGQWTRISAVHMTLEYLPRQAFQYDLQAVYQIH